MKCIILAAGYATRLYPLTENFPKPLLDVGGKPILDWLVDDLSPVIEEFVVISNHKFAAHFEKWAANRGAFGKAEDGQTDGRTADGVRITVVDDGTETNETRLGAVRDIQFAAEKLQIRDDCMVMAGDNVLDFSLTGFVEFSRKAGTSCVMCHEEHRLEALRKTAVITIEPDGLITSYEEKPMEPKGTLAVPPFYYYRAEDLQRIPEALSDGCGYDAPGSFAAWLSRKRPMHAYVMPGKRHDIGDRKSYDEICRNYQGVKI